MGHEHEISKKISFFDGMESSCTLPRQKDVTQLLSHIINGKDVEAKNMIEKNPKLILGKGSVRISVNGPLQEYTPINLAYNQLNFPLYNTMMLKLLGMHKDKKPFVQQIMALPDTDHIEFTPLIEAIDDGSSMEAPLVNFRQQLAEASQQKHFPIQALIHAYDIYANNFERWTIPQCKQFSIHVIGALQQQSPAWVKQLIAQGIHNVVERGQAFRRSFELARGGSIVNEDTVPGKGLGYDYCIDKFGVKCNLVSTPLSESELKQLKAYIEKNLRGLPQVTLTMGNEQESSYTKQSRRI